jgi:uncharacterized RDD family membrane protein YckC
MKVLRSCGIVLLWVTSLIVASGGLQPAAAADKPGTASDNSAAAADKPAAAADRPAARSHGHGHDLVNIGHDSDLPAGERADSVVSVFGSSSAEGDASDVVSVFGDTTVKGSVRHSAVAVFGDTMIDGSVDGDVVAVLGNVQLGPDASVGGDVVAVGGKVERDPAALVHGTVQTVIGSFAGFGWLKPWIDHCLFYGRPLALAPGLGWAWSLALAFLALYVALAWLFRDGVGRCVQTVESQPGMTLIAALITVLLTPVLVVLLCITFVGIAAVPFVAVGLLCVSLFGKTVMLAWLGHRTVGARAAGRFAHPAFAVLVGGAIALVLYLVPVLGFIVYKMLGLFGLGAVVYTLVQISRAKRAEHVKAATGAGVASGPAAPPDPTVAASPGFAASPAFATSPGFAPGPSVPPDPAVAPDPGVRASAATPPAAAAVPVISAVGLPRAGFWVRMAALSIDALLVGFLMGVVHHAFDAELLVLAIYGAVMWKMRGSTVGGIVFDLQVLRLDDRPVDWETAIIRALGCFLSFAVVGLGFFWIAFDAGKQAWHDKIAGTVVVRVRKGVPLV